MGFFNAEGVHQPQGGAGLQVVQRLVVHHRAGAPEIGQVHHDATVALGKGGQCLVKCDPAGSAGAVGMEHYHRVAIAYVVVMHGQIAHGYGSGG